ncbi:tripartite tricarboxylate transporter TctB family protein [Pelagibacterium mangrovi]|uniref:tripartite tricarboxylate transporter TctB family protein n=1 Tax=Pelagibacterium mangrovi TaxID=3119828 RepID=UPI002FCAC525
MRFDDRIVGAALVLLALFVIWQGQQIPSVPGTTFGPSLMPILLGLLMAACGMTVFIGGLRAAGSVPLVDVSVWKGRPRALITAAWSILGVVLGIVLMPIIGFPVFGLLYAVPLMLLMGARLVAAVPVALVVVLAAYFAFKRLLYVPLPAGPLTFLG